MTRNFEKNSRSPISIADGYYTVSAKTDSGLYILNVAAIGCKLFTYDGREVPLWACSDFLELSTASAISIFWELHAKQLNTLRTANAALVEEVERLQAWKDAAVEVESKWDAQAIARLLGGTAGESTRTVIAREAPRLVERVKRLDEAKARIQSLETVGNDLFECASQLGWTSCEDTKWIRRAEKATKAWKSLK
jgi:hypothetical protein